MAFPILPILLVGGLMLAAAGVKKKGDAAARLPPAQAVQKAVADSPGGNPQELALRAYQLAWPGCPTPDQVDPANPDHAVCAAYYAQMLAMVMAAQAGAPIGEPSPGPLSPNVRWPEDPAGIEAFSREMEARPYPREVVVFGYRGAQQPVVHAALADVAPHFPTLPILAFDTALEALMGLPDSMAQFCEPGDAAVVMAIVEAGPQQVEQQYLDCWPTGGDPDDLHEMLYEAAASTGAPLVG